MSDIKSIKHQRFVLIPQDVNGMHLLGYLIVKDMNFQLDISLHSTTSLQGVRFCCDWRLRELLRGYEDALAKRLQQSESLTEFLEELNMLVENLLSFHRSGNSTNVSAEVLKIMVEIQNMGWHRVFYINNEFNVVKVMFRDENDRKHILTFQMKCKDFTAGLSCLVDLPVSFNEPHDGESMAQVYTRFTKVVESCQTFWNVLNDVDEKCWVITTDNTSYGCLYRRIALGSNSSLRIGLNPHQARAIPECRFLGPGHVIEPMKEKLNSNMHLWDDNKMIVDNLINVLGIVLPSRRTGNKEEILVECGICYAYQLDGTIPGHWCEGAKCAQVFHTSCLTEWLRSLPLHRQSFNVIFGECPYCSKKLTVQTGN